MKRVLVGVILAASLCQCKAGEQSGVLRTLSWSLEHKEKHGRFFVFQNSDEMKKIWKKDGGKEKDLPEVDFDSEMVIAVFVHREPLSYQDIKINRFDFLPVYLGKQTTVASTQLNVTSSERSYIPPSGQTKMHSSHVIVVKKKSFKALNFEPMNKERLESTKSWQSSEK